MSDGTWRVELPTCPASQAGRPDIESAFLAHARQTGADGALWRAGGLEDQDAWELSAVAVLRQEEDAIRAAMMTERQAESQRERERAGRRR
jgi:hypothetical protein